MSPTAFKLRPPRSGSIVLDGINWRTYSRALQAFAEQPGIRMAYDQGRLEIMSPLLQHDDDGRFLGRIVCVLTEEMNLPLKAGGSTTLRRQLKQRGIEADECFWIGSAPRMRGRRRLDLRRDPPPDLAIEVDVTRSSLNRLDIYAAFRIPEIWRLDGDVLTFYRLGPNGKYRETPTSLAFPAVTPANLLSFLQRARRAGDENPIINAFRVWIRKRLAKP